MTGRLDRVLVERGLARSRTHAQSLVKAGEVRVDGEVVRRPARPVPPDAALSLTAAGEDSSRWVGRGAMKLLAALAAHPALAAAVDGGRCLDVGASTGGFTQVLLEHAAREVVALDVGHDQLAPSIAADPRVVERSGVNARDARAADLGRYDVIVCDVSFISVTLLFPVLRALCLPLAHLVVLVKPQFEVGRERIGDGVVTDRHAWARVLRTVAAAADVADLGLHALDPSPVTGAEGNHEFLAWLRPAAAPGETLTGEGLAARIRALTVGVTG